MNIFLFLIKTTLISVLLLSQTTMADALTPALPDFSPNKSNAVVYIYRESAFKGIAIDFRNYVNDVGIGVIESNSYLRAEIPEGEHDLWTITFVARSGGDEVRARGYFPLIVKANKVYFVKQEPILSNLPYVASSIVNPSIAKNEILAIARNRRTQEENE